MSIIVGKIMPRPMGEYNSTVTYKILDLVTLNNRLWIAKQTDFKGMTPSDDSEYWMLCIDGVTDVQDLGEEAEARITEIANQITELEESVDAKLAATNSNISTVQSSLSSRMTELEETVSSGFANTDQQIQTLDEQKANMSTALEVTVLADAWSDNVAPYINILTVSGVTADSLVEVMVPDDITDEQLEAYRNANIEKCLLSLGRIDLYAYGTKPTIDLPLLIIIRGDI